MRPSPRALLRQLRKSRSPAKPLLDAGGPRFSASHAGHAPVFTGELKLVTWNIRLGKEIGAAIAQLQTEPELAGADIVLLQEMGEAGADRIAQALGCEFLYYPACRHCDTGGHFGNAIISRWPLREPGKVLLPHLSPRTGENRIATRAIIDAGGRELLVYSVHTETFALHRDLRREQFRVLAKDIEERMSAQGATRVIAAGDFNTLWRRDERMLDGELAAAGLRRVSAGTPATVHIMVYPAHLDHVFTKGLDAVAAGTGKSTAASDHSPLWVTLRV